MPPNVPRRGRRPAWSTAQLPGGSLAMGALREERIVSRSMGSSVVISDAPPLLICGSIGVGDIGVAGAGAALVERAGFVPIDSSSEATPIESARDSAAWRKR